MEKDRKHSDYEQFAAIREQSVGRLLWRMKRYMDSFVEPKLQAAGFQDFKMSYLALLANIEETGITNNELAKRACVSKQMMSKTVRLLEAEGYIVTRRNAVDSRSSVIFLSDRGQELFLTLRDCMEQVHARFDAIVGHDRMAAMIDTLRELTNAVDTTPT